MSEFMENFNNPLMQSVRCTYKGKEYIVFGYWSICVIDDDDNDREIDNGELMTKYDALDYKVFDDGTKSLRDIYDEITDVEFDF